jgi:hypothetical protein
MQTIDFARECLSLHILSPSMLKPTNEIIASFRDIREQLAKDYSLGKSHYKDDLD